MLINAILERKNAAVGVRFTVKSAAAVWTQIQTGLIGLVLQAVLVPVIVIALRALMLRESRERE